MALYAQLSPCHHSRSLLARVTAFYVRCSGRGSSTRGCEHFCIRYGAPGVGGPWNSPLGWSFGHFCSFRQRHQGVPGCPWISRGPGNFGTSHGPPPKPLMDPQRSPNHTLGLAMAVPGCCEPAMETLGVPKPHFWNQPWIPLVTPQGPPEVPKPHLGNQPRQYLAV